MKIKANQQLYKGISIAIATLFIFISSLGYFLGFDINVFNFCIYLLILLSIACLSLLLYFVIDRINHKYIVFDNEKIIEQNRYAERILVYRHQILHTKYHNSINLIWGIIDFGYVEIAYRVDSRDKNTKYINLYLSPKVYKDIFES